MKNQNKIIGTLAPLPALYSKSYSDADNGTFKAGKVFLKWLQKTNQSAWQLLPLQETEFEKESVTKRVPSPYKGYGIGIGSRYISTDFSGKKPSSKELEEFTEANTYWVEDYALYCALSEEFGTDDWSKWEEAIKKYDLSAVNHWNHVLKESIQKHIVIQWRAHSEYAEMKHIAESFNINIIGDLPFYLPYKSPLVWKNQNLFRLEANGDMRYTSGFPANKKSYFGRQVWGHPLYKWNDKKIVPLIIQFWELRIRYLSRMFDYVRIDHPVGFFRYGIIDTQNPKNDTFVPGIGAQIFTEIMKYAMEQGLNLIAEEFGKKTSTLYSSLQKLGIPGSIITRWAYNEKSDKLIEYYSKTKEYPQKAVIYTSTHDTDTLIGILNKLNENQKKKMISNMDIAYSSDNKELAQRIIQAVLASPAEMIMVQIQDWLLIEDRINTPGTELGFNDPNWNLKLPPIEAFPESGDLG